MINPSVVVLSRFIKIIAKSASTFSIGDLDFRGDISIDIDSKIVVTL